MRNRERERSRLTSSSVLPKAPLFTAGSRVELRDLADKSQPLVELLLCSNNENRSLSLGWPIQHACRNADREKYRQQQDRNGKSSSSIGSSGDSVGGSGFVGSKRSSLEVGPKTERHRQLDNGG